MATRSSRRYSYRLLAVVAQAEAGRPILWGRLRVSFAARKEVQHDVRQGRCGYICKGLMERECCRAWQRAVRHMEANAPRVSRTHWLAKRHSPARCKRGVKRHASVRSTLFRAKVASFSFRTVMPP